MKNLRLILTVFCAMALLVGVAHGEDAVSSATLNVDALPPIAANESATVLVAYFSTSDTIRAAAVIAAEALNADLFEIVPKEGYTEDDLNYSDNSSRTSREQQDASARPEIAQLPGDLSRYDTILLGYPIWWGQAPRILYTFVESVDLGGKTVLPFCTSSSSSAGSSAANLQALTDGTSIWLDAVRLDNGSDAETIRAWAQSLNVGSEAEMRMKINDTVVNVEWENNESVTALKALAKNGLTVSMSMYGGFEQVGSLGASLPRNDRQTTTQAGDIVLYSGSQIVVFYGSNSWAYTRLGHITDRSAADMAALLGNGDVTVTIDMN